jgi:hypothetical protein
MANDQGAKGSTEPRETIVNVIPENSPKEWGDFGVTELQRRFPGSGFKHNARGPQRTRTGAC